MWLLAAKSLTAEQNIDALYEGEFAWRGDPWKAYSMDLGACSFFIPWAWEHRLDGAYYTAGLGASFENRGLAEHFIDEMADTSEPRSQTEVSALLWIDATAGIAPNESASPEFHYRPSEDTGRPEICFKQYFHASSDISAKPDHWYRFDQGLGSLVLELLLFIGKCGSKNVASECEPANGDRH